MKITVCFASGTSYWVFLRLFSLSILKYTNRSQPNWNGWWPRCVKMVSSHIMSPISDRLALPGTGINFLRKHYLWISELRPICYSLAYLLQMHRTWLTVGYKWSTIVVEIKRQKGAASIHNHSILSITLFMSSKNLNMLIRQGKHESLAWINPIIKTNAISASWHFKLFKKLSDQ